MKVRKKTLCRTCRRRKISCDGKRPACSQCFNSGRSCEGYPDALFVPWNSSSDTAQIAPRPSPKRVPDESSRLSVSVPSMDPVSQETNLPCNNPIYPCLIDPWQNTISQIVRNYVPHRDILADITEIVPQSPRICGSWVTALPDLAATSSGAYGECLTSAMNALAFSIMSYRNSQKLIQPISLSYGHTLNLLRQNLQSAKRCYNAEQTAAVMCIALLEITSPTSPNGSIVHIHGVGELIQLSSPENFSTGVHHKLFVGIRPLLVIQAFMSRKATFLANENWIKGPFQLHQQSPLQNLLNVAASIPGISERIDALKNQPADKISEVAKACITQLAKTRMKLESWANSFEAESPAPLYWHQVNDEGSDGENDSLLFPSLSTANALTYLWSFQVICMSHIEDLIARFPDINEFRIIMSVAQLRRSCIELSKKIFQSMEFVMQDGFMLYGRFSVGFPIHTAYHCLNAYLDRRAVLRKVGKSILDRIDVEASSFSGSI